MMTMHEFVERVYGEPLSPIGQKTLEMFQKFDKDISKFSVTPHKDSCKTEIKRRMFDANKILKDQL